MKNKNAVSNSPKGVIVKTHRIAAAAALAVALLCLAEQAVYAAVVRPRGAAYLFDWMAPAIAAFTLFAALAGCRLWFGGAHRTARITQAALLIALALALRFTATAVRAETTITSLAPGGSSLLVLEWEPDTGRMVYCRPLLGVLRYEKTQMPYTVSGEPKLQWLTDDACAITYTTTDGTVHQYIATYGDRGSGISYYYMTAAIHGSWQVDGQDAVGWKLSADQSGITIKNATMSEFYAYSDCVSFGTIGLALCRDGYPQWTLVMNEDCHIGNDCLIEAGGTLTLCAVSMDRTAPLTLRCIDYKG